MPEKPFKKSSYARKDDTNYKRDVDSDLSTIFNFLGNYPRVYTQSAEPSLSNDTWGFWKDSDDSKFYLLLNIAGTQKKVELT